MTAAAFSLFLFATPAVAGLNEGIEAYKAQDYETAFAEIEPAAFTGNPQAAYYMGMMYEQGEGVRQSASTAWVWYQKAAAKFPEAQYRLGLMFQSGRGVPLNPKVALSWYLKAAEKDHRQAMVAVGMTYLKGRGVHPDLMKAQQWLEKAAALGDAGARSKLDQLVADGLIARLPPEGVSSPVDDDMQNVLTDVNLMLRPYLEGTIGTRMTLGEAPRIKKDGAKSFIVYLPDVKLYGQGSEGPTLVGTVRLGLKPVNGEQYQVDVVIPSAISLADENETPLTTLTFARQKVSFLWSMTLGTALQGDVQYSDIKVRDTSGLVEVDIASLNAGLVTEEPRPDVIDGKESLVLKGLNIRSPQSPGENLTLSSLSFAGSFKELDVRAYLDYLTTLGVDWQAGKVPTNVVDRMLNGDQEIPILFSGLSFSTNIEGLNVAGVNVRGGDIGVTLNDLNTDNAWVHLTMGMKKLDAPSLQALAPIDVLPQSVSGAVTISGIPSKALLAQLTSLLRETMAQNPDLASGMTETAPLPMETLTDAFDMPLVEVRVDEVLVLGSYYDAKINGSFKTVPSGDQLAADGTLFFAIRGLEKILTDTPDKRLLDLADVSEDAEGRTVHSFRVKFTPEGDILVNGTPADDLFGKPAPKD